ncbi:hypothetical protein [Bacillus sp. AFS096315]|uniref:hypothetical protein n=1 Tax=Bacillus sp. AFS096315 TaxID=2033517 RepID=UPI000BEBF896|nr:hypothetical protein [Bacillus sp. AFS096315]PEC49810.1 hypothetical protein CON00_08055 [Bacillus sp. AFS096315]
MKKWNLVILFLLVCSLLIAGCTSAKPSGKPEDVNVDAIEQVLIHQFSDDKVLVKLVESGESATVIGSDGKVTQPKNPTKLETYYKKLYGAYFTKNAFNAFVSVHAFRYVMLAHDYNYIMSVHTMDISEDNSTKGAYDFLVHIELEKDGKNKNADVTGRVNFNNEGKITYIRYDDETFNKLLMK